MVSFERLSVRDMFSYGIADVYFLPGKLILVDGENKDTRAGSNQVGKTSLFDALTTVLWEANSRGQVKNDVINRAKDSCEAVVTVNGIDVYYRRSKSGGEWFYVKDGEKKCFLWNEMRRAIEREVLGGMTYKEFCLTSWIHQASVNEFVKASDAERKEIFVDWFGLHVYLKARDKVKEEVQQLDIKILQLQQALKELRDIEQKLQYLDFEQVKEAKNFVEKYKDGIVDYAFYEAERKRVLDILRKHRIAKKLSQVVEAIKRKLLEIEKDIRLMSEKLKYLGDDVCWVCGSRINGAQLKRHVEQDLHTKKTQKEEFMRVLDQWNIVNRYIYVDRRELIEKVWGMKSKVGDISRYREAVQLLSLYEQLSHLSCDIQQRKQQLLQEIDILQKRKSIVEPWLKGFSDDGIIIFVVKRCFDILNLLMEKYSQVFGLNVKCHISKGGRIELEVSDKHKSFKKVDYLSSSEKMVVSLIVLLSVGEWLKAFGKGSNLLVLDEVFAVFDDKWRSLLCELLMEEKRKRERALVVITHHRDVKSMLEVDELWWIEKKDGISNLKVLS